MEPLKKDTSSLKIPKVLGWAGLIPFALATLGTHSEIDPLVRHGFFGGTTYGAMILGFLGAVHWGLTMQDDRSPQWYIWSITPTLLGFCVLLIPHVEMRIFALLPLFGFAWLVDRRAANVGLIPNWYMRLRSILTAGALSSLSVMLLAYLF